MDRQAIINDILRTALGGNDNRRADGTADKGGGGGDAGIVPTIVINARQVIVVNGPLILSDGGLRAAEDLAARRPGLFGQALRSPEQNRKALERLGPPRF